MAILICEMSVKRLTNEYGGAIFINRCNKFVINVNDCSTIMEARYE